MIINDQPTLPFPGSSG